ncbi:MAG: photosystem II reaction center PsbP family protein [Syntrophales bacterium]|nr:photosystem II reaction center PsbP family protein [Syntrophales bacterium]
MGFFDKVFGGKAAGGSAPGPRGDFRTLDVPEKGFSIAVPQDWTLVEGPAGLEAHPKECGRVADPASGREISSPGVLVTLSDVPDPRQNAVKETIKARSTSMAGHRMVKHMAGDVRNADFGIVYEYQYGPGDAPVRALGAVAQKKNRLFTVAAVGTAQDFEKSRSTLEAVIASFKLF